MAHHTTHLHNALNVFISHIIPSHRTTKRFYITPPFTSHHFTPHHSTSHHNCTTFHITLLHTTCSTPHLRHLMLQHISPRTTIFYIGHHITPQSASVPPPFHTTSQSTCSTSHSHSLHISHHPTYITIPHHTYIHIIAYFTPHHIPRRITPPRRTSQHVIASFSTSDITQQSHSTLYMPHSSSPQFHTTTFTSHRNFPHLVLCNIPHTRTPRQVPHQTFCISITPCLNWQHSHNNGHFYGAWSLARSRAQCAVQKDAEKNV